MIITIAPIWTAAMMMVFSAREKMGKKLANFTGGGLLYSLEAGSVKGTTYKIHHNAYSSRLTTHFYTIIHV